MKTIRAFLHAFGDRHTYDVRTNVHLWFGLLWGIPVPIFLLILSDESSLARFLQGGGMKAVFLLHPVLFALVFGALGSMRAKLEMANELLIEELKSQAWFDPLTGLYNRRYIMEEFRNILRRSVRSRAPVRAILFDLDGFKSVNDRLGHLEGDKILHAAAAALRGGIRQGDLLGRFGGDEFLLVAIGTPAAVREIVDRCRAAVQSATGLSISAGIADVLTSGEPPESLIRRADEDLAASKRRTYAARGLQRR
jgi:diguanylate cyclase (GGDEF)-like protein